MVIENNAIVIDGRTVKLNTPYQEVSNIIGDSVYVSTAPDMQGNGSIVLKHQEFYNLKGTCTLYFQGNKLIQISMQPDWSMYSFKDDRGNRLPIDVALSKVANENERALRNSLDFVEKPTYENSVFRKDNIYIISVCSTKPLKKSRTALDTRGERLRCFEFDEMAGI